jgi:hypothetical protein
MLCSTNFHEHYLLFLVLFLVLCECCINGVFVVLCEHWICCFVNTKFAGCFVNIVLFQGFRVGASDVCVVL